MLEKKKNNFQHQPVLLNEVIKNFKIKKNGIYVDCTIGLGGHSSEILKHLQSGHLIGLDKDQSALNITSKKLIDNNNLITLIKSDYFNLEQELASRKIAKVDGILFDLGVSSMQLDDATRGFSYQNNGPLDMRMDQTQTITANSIINNASVKELSMIIRKNSEAKYSTRVAEKIVELRPINSTSEFVNVLKKALPSYILRKKHPGKTYFQAFRIEVNGELTNLRESLKNAINLLNKDGILQVITFHSIEDRIVKKLFYDLTVDQTKDLPIMNHKKFIKRQVKPSKSEILTNPRSRSAKLRILRKLY